MSRIGKKLIELPEGVNAVINNNTIEVNGPKGSREFKFSDKLEVSIADKNISVSPRNLEKETRQLWGMSRTQIANLVKGVEKGFSKELEINGVGYRAAVQGNILKLSLGYSHDVDFEIPSDVKIECPKQNIIKLTSINKERLGAAAAKIRSFRKPEPFKGKGIKYVGEHIRRKAGKSA